MTEDLREAVEALFAEQAVEWPRLREGLAGLERARTAALATTGPALEAIHVPHRIASTTAPVDAASVAARPCFLCPQNLDPEERGLPFGEFTMYANPFPIVPRHLTVVHREHRPQRLAGQVGALLDLAAALPGFSAFYNGPRCGASAPDHLHLQAGLAPDLPAFAAARRVRGLALEGYPARALVVRGDDPSRVVSRVHAALAALDAAARQEPEPWVNVAAQRDDETGFTVLLFPRAKHRPDAFLTGDLLVSPASVDVCGLVVVPREKDFQRLFGEQVAALLREVSLGEAPFRAAVAALDGAG